MNIKHCILKEIFCILHLVIVKRMHKCMTLHVCLYMYVLLHACE